MNATDPKPAIVLVHGAFAADLPPEVTALMAATQRAGAGITEVEGSHVIMISQPQAVTDVIVTAARAVAGARR